MLPDNRSLRKKHAFRGFNLFQKPACHEIGQTDLMTYKNSVSGVRFPSVYSCRMHLKVLIFFRQTLMTRGLTYLLTYLLTWHLFTIAYRLKAFGSEFSLIVQSTSLGYNFRGREREKHVR